MTTATTLNSSAVKGVVDQVANLTLKIHEHFKQYDYSKMVFFHEKLLRDQSLLDEFVKNPEKVVERETGIPTLEGMHYHFLDQTGRLRPSEVDDVEHVLSGEGEGPWSRIEIRLSSQNGSALLGCGICIPLGGGC